MNHPPFVSTGTLPPPEWIQALLENARALFSDNTDGQNSQVYPALARVPSFE